MNLNSKELQKFYDLWSPMLQALPAVIEAAEREEELKRGVAILEKNVRLDASGAHRAHDSII